MVDCKISGAENDRYQAELTILPVKIKCYVSLINLILLYAKTNLLFFSELQNERTPFGIVRVRSLTGLIENEQSCQ